MTYSTLKEAGISTLRALEKKRITIDARLWWFMLGGSVVGLLMLWVGK